MLHEPKDVFTVLPQKAVKIRQIDEHDVAERVDIVLGNFERIRSDSGPGGICLHVKSSPVLRDGVVVNVGLWTRCARADLLVRGGDLLARHAGRETGELQAELGLTLPERLGETASGRVSERIGETTSGRTSAQLLEGANGCRLVVWVGGEVAQPHVIAEFPKVRDVCAASMQSAVVKLAVEVTHARTLDELRGEVL